jgi:hypothetical protein
VTGYEADVVNVPQRLGYWRPSILSSVKPSSRYYIGYLGVALSGYKFFRCQCQLDCRHTCCGAYFLSKLRAENSLVSTKLGLAPMGIPS